MTDRAAFANILSEKNALPMHENEKFRKKSMGLEEVDLEAGISPFFLTRTIYLGWINCATYLDLLDLPSWISALTDVSKTKR